MRRPFPDPQMRAVFDAYPASVRSALMRLRELIFESADESGAGELIETLKWHQPAYLPAKARTGTTVRIDASKEEPNGYAMFFHCQTTLVHTFRELYPKVFAFEGNRALLFTAAQSVPEDELTHCISLALTYHSRKPAS